MGDSSCSSRAEFWLGRRCSAQDRAWADLMHLITSEMGPQSFDPAADLGSLTMRIARDQVIAGLPALEVRRLLRQHYDFGWFLESAADTLGMDEAETQPILEALEKEGFIRRGRVTEGRQVWETELKGRQLAKAGAGPGYRRQTAERHLEQFLVRVSELAERPEFLHRVRKVILFGSFLDPTRDPVGDVDLAIDLVFKEQDRDKALRLADDYAGRAIGQGRRFSSFVDQLFAAENDARRFLKGKSPVLQLTGIDDPILELAAQKVIYEDRSARTRHGL